MVRMPWGGRFTRPQMLAWQYFGDRLNEAGCMGDAYVPTTLAFGADDRAAGKKRGVRTVLEEARETQARGAVERATACAREKENGCE